VVPVIKGVGLLLNVPPAPPSLHETVPEGADCVPALLSETVTVKVIEPPVVTLDGLGLSDVLVVRRDAVNTVEPELVE
jgi:hypothetical protein